MKKLISAAIFILLASISGATVVYNTGEDMTQNVGGSKYWASRLTPGAGTVPPTITVHRTGNPGSNYYIPGMQSPGAIHDITDTPQGYGWATDLNLASDIPAGQWNFGVTTRNNVDENGGGHIGVNVFKYCNGENTRLFYAQGTRDAVNTASQVAQVISTNQPMFSTQNCSLKFEYWLSVSDVSEDNSNSILNVNSDQFYIEFPSPQAGECQDSDSDGYQSAGCGGNDCNDASPNINPGAAETCNGVDDNCNGQADENLQRQGVCGTGACQTTVNQTCSAGIYSPVCVPRNCSCTPGETKACGSSIGACIKGNQTCLSNGTWSLCIGGRGPAQETCNGIDDDCNNKTDENLQQIIACGSGSCRASANQTCISGRYTPLCIPKAPGEELCNGIDDDCNNQTDEGLSKSCGSNVGNCRQGVQTCSYGTWSKCAGEVKPMEEICDFKDNDCNGNVDEDDVCKKDIAPPCAEAWECSEWSSCINNANSTRACSDKNKCGTDTYRPQTEKPCFNSLAEKKNEPIDDRQALGFLTVGSISVMMAAAFLVSRGWKKNEP